MIGILIYIGLTNPDRHWPVFKTTPSFPSKITPFFRHNDTLWLCSVSSFGLYGTLAYIIIREVHENVVDDGVIDASTYNRPSDSKVSLFIISDRNYPDFMK